MDFLVLGGGGMTFFRVKANLSMYFFFFGGFEVVELLPGCF